LLNNNFFLVAACCFSFSAVTARTMRRQLSYALAIILSQAEMPGNATSN
jgi:hypothetical protein